MSEYPQLEVNLDKLENNIKQIKSRCDKLGIKLAGVIKGCNAIPEVAMEFERQGVMYIASSRLDQLKPLRSHGIKTPFLLIRIPMLSEVDEVIELCDCSLNSELVTIEALNKSAKDHGIIHNVILMKDLGDLREGFFKDEEIIDVAKRVEEMSNVHLLGIGTNLGCYGAVSATEEKMKELVDCAEKIEACIGRRLEIISGGATTSLPRILDGNMPERINMLRVGEGILLARDLKDLWHYDQSYMYQDVFTLKCEVIEVKDKPTHPIGEIMFDAFGNKPTYVDRGIRKRALLAIGKVDYANIDDLIVLEDGIEVIGASSDHTIIDIEDSKRDIKVGDIIEFHLTYSTLVYLSNSKNVKIKLVRGK